MLNDSQLGGVWGLWNTGQEGGAPGADIDAPKAWDLTTGSRQKNVFWAVTGTAPTRELVVEWRNVRRAACSRDSAATVTFQVVFGEGSSDFLMNFADVDFGGVCTDADRGGSATIDVQMTAELATQVSFDTPWLQDQTALLWTWPASVAENSGGSQPPAIAHSHGPALPYLPKLE